jgi:hypothetical protein
MRFAVALISLYLLLDFSDPGLPGAFNFNAEESVEAVQAQKVSSPQRPTMLAPEPASTTPGVHFTDAAPAFSAVAAGTTVAPARHHRRLLRPRLGHPTSEEASPASLAA